MEGREGMPSSGGASDAEKRQQQEVARRNMLDQILSPEARERRNLCTDWNQLSSYLYVVSRITLVKPEKGRSLEDFLIQNLQSGRIRNRVSEPDLLNILDTIDAQEQKQRSSKIVVQNLSKILQSNNSMYLCSTREERFWTMMIEKILNLSNKI